MITSVKTLNKGLLPPSFTPCLLAAVCILAAGCAPPQKPDSLNQLQELLSEPEVALVKETQGATKYLSEARQYERLALDAWKRGELQESQEYGLLGTLRYKTARTMYDRNEIHKKINHKNSDLQQVNLELKRLSKQRDELLIDVSNLNQQLVIEKKKAYGRTSDTELYVAPTSRPTLQATSATSQNLALRRQLSQLIILANEKQARAEEVNAAKFAPRLYSLSLNKLKSIQTSLDNNQPSDSMIPELKEIAQAFDEAYQEAKPLYRQAKDREDIPLRRNQLIQALRGVVDEKTSVLNTPTGSRVVFSALFPRKSGYLDSEGEARVQRVADIAKQFDDFSILIEGFTAKVGSATDGLSTSQMRAQQVSKVFEQAGIARGKIEWRAVGRTDFRFDPASGNENDRVEVVIQRF